MSAITERLEKMIGRRVRILPENGNATVGVLRFVDANGRILVEANADQDSEFFSDKPDVASYIVAVDPFNAWVQIQFLKEP